MTSFYLLIPSSNLSHFCYQISKQLVQEAHKKEISEMIEKLKAEEETRKTLHKVRRHRIFSLALEGGLTITS